jgi:pantoate--beta-alanine ligase
MLVFESTGPFIQHLRETGAGAGKTGFVPTMGALHEGHLSLIARSKGENKRTVCSIFVNPTQFNDPSDLEKYPRTPVTDTAILESRGCDILFIPKAGDIYKDGLKLLDISFGSMETVMEGQYRPGHFKGVATVVHKLFEIVKPDNAYFGEKDYQQLTIIRELARRMHPGINIVGCPTMREADGLAMSSRNVLLTPEQRREAPVIYKALQAGSGWIKSFTPSEVKEMVKAMIGETKHLNVQYFEIVDPVTLMPVDDARQDMRACIAVLTGGPRLIDNMAYAGVNV